MIVHRHLIPNLGSIPLTQLQPSPSHLQNYYARALSTGRADGRGGLSARSVLHIHRVLSEALKHAVRWQMVARNVALAVSPPRPRQPQMTTLTEEQLAVFLQQASLSVHYDLFYMALFTVMRRGELLWLRWKDVDLHLAQLFVTQTIQRISGMGFVKQESKTARSRRAIALSTSVCIMLRRHREDQQAHRLLLGTSLREDDLVFSRPDGRPLHPAKCSPRFQADSKEGGNPPYPVPRPQAHARHPDAEAECPSKDSQRAAGPQ